MAGGDSGSGGQAMQILRRAPLDRTAIRGVTHCLYRYPAHFSPIFAAAAIEAFSRPEQIVLDPFMGGGTTIVEAVVRSLFDGESVDCFVVRAERHGIPQCRHRVYRRVY